MSVNIRQIINEIPELDFLMLSQKLQNTTNVRDRISRLLKSKDLIGIVPGIYVLAEELRKRPVDLGILANQIYGPSYVSFEYVLSQSGLIPEAVYEIGCATVKRSAAFDTALGLFCYYHLPNSAYTFGWKRQELADGSGYLIAYPEKALLDLLYKTGAVRSVKALEERFFEDLRIDINAFSTLDHLLLLEYSKRMPGATFQKYLVQFLGRAHE